MTAKKTIYIIRHGQTDYNLKGIIQGSGINSDLNATGRDQAQLFHKKYADHPFKHIYTSELKRTHQSVEPFAETRGNLIALPAFNEINWGKFEGMQITPEIHLSYQEIIKNWEAGNLDLEAGGGESPNMLAGRQRAGIEQVMDETGMDDILICTHGRAMRSLFCVLLGIPLTEMERFEHTNLCLYQFETKDGREFRMTLQNETSHLNSI